MKKFITTLMILPVILLAKGQPDPASSTVFCPGTTYTFHYTMTGSISDFSGAQAAGIAVSGVAGSQAVQGISAVSLSSGGTTTVWTFTGRFTDWATPHGIRLSWVDIHGANQSITYQYNDIASYHNASATVARPQPSPSSVSAPLAQINTFNISVPTLQYVDDFVSPVLKYGSVTNFEYLLPQNWKLGTTASDGVTWIGGTGTVSVTTDACTGGNILIRGVTCATGLTTGPPLPWVHLPAAPFVREIPVSSVSIACLRELLSPGRPRRPVS
jgi:hypothetical protein